MFRPKDRVDWQTFWSDLLQGTGAGLLHYDGSRLAQAALMGLDAFDAAQERRGRRKSPNDEGAAEHREQEAVTLPWRDMSGAEIAAFQRLSPEAQNDFREEAGKIGLWPDIPDDTEFQSVISSLRRAPSSANPFEGWLLEKILPFGRDGRLNISTFRR